MLIVSSVVSSLSLNLASTIAATFSFSETNVFTENFSSDSQGVLTATNTSRLAIGINGLVYANELATALISSSPSSSQKYSLSAASGLINNYFGLAQNHSAIGGSNFSSQEKLFHTKGMRK